MAATAWAYYDSFKAELLDKTMNLETDALKIGLFLSTSNAATLTTATYAALTNEHANANGYTTAGFAVAGTTTGANFDIEDASWTAAGGSIVTRFAVLYNSTTGGLIAYSLLDSAPADVTTTDTNTLTIAINAAGVFDLA